MVTFDTQHFRGEIIGKKALFQGFIALTLLANALSATSAEEPASPYVNPHLAASSYSVTHQAGDLTNIAGPLPAPKRRLRPDEIEWKPVGPINGYPPTYSGPYPNGKRVIWVSGYDRVSKLDADTLETLTTYAIGGNTYFGEDELRRQMDTLDKLGPDALIDYFPKLVAEAWPSVGSAYKLLSSDNELYLPYTGQDGIRSLRVYGEEDSRDPASKIRMRREWKLPAELSKTPFVGMQMTSDGWIVIATGDGYVVALSRDFSAYQKLRLPSKNGEWPSQDFMSYFVRNGLAADDQGGIYVVTRDYMHRVQWTGSKLSLDEVDGAWSASYPNEHGRGSGTTPALMGWGPNEDHLVVIGDGSKSNNAMVFWRDAIPTDWKGLSGYDRRVAGITPVRFGVSPNEEVQTENAAIVYGYGAFFVNTFPQKHLPDQGGATKQWMRESLLLNLPGREALGGSMIEWDSHARTFNTVWRSQANFGGCICTVSSATRILYCSGAKNGEWTFEGYDWQSGKNVIEYLLGKSQRFDPIGGPLIIAPNGSVDGAFLGALGITRFTPKPVRHASGQ